MSQSTAEALSALATRARNAHSDVVLAPLKTIEAARSAVEAAQERHQAQADAATATNAKRLANSRAAVERGLQAVLTKHPNMPRHNLAAAVHRWLDVNWSRSFSLTTISARLDELLPRVTRHQNKSRHGSEL